MKAIVSGPPFFWSPDSQRLVAMQTQEGETRTVYHIESAPSDQLQPKLHEMTYAKPGDRLPVKRPHMFDISNQSEIEIANPELFENAWSILRERWSSDSQRFDFLYNARGHQVVRLIGIDADGNAKSIIDEESKTFVDYAYKLFCHYTEGESEVVWMSERDGWNHLYLYDHSGRLKNQITCGSWVVRGVERVNEETRQIWFRASGVFSEQDPYFIHLGRVDFDGGNLTWLTKSPGNHRWEFDPTGKFLVDSWSRVDQAPVHELRSAADGQLIRFESNTNELRSTLESADMSDLRQAGWLAPESFVAKGPGWKDRHIWCHCSPNEFRRK